MIEVHALTKYYDQRPAIQDVTFSVPRGQALGFLGPKGAGKSTTMRILTGYLGSSAGKASVGGYDVFDHSLEARRRIGYLPETAPVYNELRVGGYLNMMCKLRGIAPSVRRARVDNAIQVCGLGDRRSEVIGRLSRGLRRRVGLAQAIVHEPQALILDEPTAGLDPDQTREIRDLIKELGRRYTVIVSSHTLPEVSATCERVLIINHGRLVADDTPERLVQRLATVRGHEVEMLLRGEPADIEERIRAFEWVGEVAISDAGDGLLRVLVTTAKADVREDLARAAVEAGFGLRELHARTPDLEEIFVNLITEETE